MDDEEVAALTKINGILKSLDEDARFRVMQWAYNRYQPSRNSAVDDVPSAPKLLQASDDPAHSASADRDYSTFAEMLDASGADSEPKRFLVAAYWLESVEEQGSFQSYDITKLLKATGNQPKAIGNSTKALINSTPKRIVQMSRNKAKAGKGRISFKLTSQGVKDVRGMLIESPE